VAQGQAIAAQGSSDRRRSTLSIRATIQDPAWNLVAPPNTLSTASRVLIAAALLAAMLASCATGDQDEGSEPVQAPECETATTDDLSVAHLWIEATLDAIRRDFPAPTVHSRNLWHLSAAMWDGWALYTPGATPYFGGESIDVPAPERVAAIQESISVAAHKLLTERYQSAVGAETSLAQFDQLLAALCVEPAAGDVSAAGAVGLEIAERVLEHAANDGSLEIDGYVDLSYVPVNEPLVVAGDEIAMVDPNRWQPLQITQRATQNGQAEGGGAQVFIGANWGSVTSFALPAADDPRSAKPQSTSLATPTRSVAQPAH